MGYILAIDQGTSSTKAILFNGKGKAVAKAQAKLKTDYFDNGHVEQDPESIYKNVLDAVNDCILKFLKKGFALDAIEACGISNQRETFLLWDKNGKPLSHAVVWACKRSVEICQNLLAKGLNDLIRPRTGLLIDPYFSATKLLWLLQYNTGLKSKLEAGEVYFGTVDCWLLFKMTEGTVFKTDYTNAHRTLLFNIHSLQWDKELLKLWGLEALNLPQVGASSSHFGNWNLIHHITSLKKFCNSFTLPITAMIGDSHAATFGEGCFEAGTAKVTMGTGSSIMMNTGNKPIISKKGLLTTIAWSTENRIDYALEGAIVSCGSTVEWLKNELGFFKKATQTEAMANNVIDNAGVYLIPAFSGLGAPHWQMQRKASLEGLTFGTTKNHIVRAALESVPYQIKDVIETMRLELNKDLKGIAVNGGLTKNSFVMSFLVDLLCITIYQQSDPDVSALGAAYLAGLKSGLYENIETLKLLNSEKTTQLHPNVQNTKVLDWYHTWTELILKY